MEPRRRIEVFSAGCGVCSDAVARVRDLACASCEVTVVDLRDASGAERARSLGVRSLPAVAVDGRLADCCAGRGIDRGALRAAGVGRPLGQG